VVELFMLDYLPRHVTLSAQKIDGLPNVLTAWMRFALGKRGLLASTDVAYRHENDPGAPATTGTDVVG